MQRQHHRNSQIIKAIIKENPKNEVHFSGLVGLQGVEPWTH